MKSIDEMIADAQAEEEVKREVFEADIRDSLRDRVKEAIKDDVTVRVPLTKYEELISDSIDLARLLKAIVADAELNYHADGLRIDGSNVADAFKILYTEEYYKLVDELRKKKDK